MFWSLPADGSHLDLWQLMQPGERRTDVYLVCTADVGVKLREGRELEVKLRVGRDDGDSEKWKKLDGGKRRIALFTDH